MDNQQNNPPLGGEKNGERKFEAAVKNYTGPEGITTKQLEVGLWYVEHKRLLRRILYGFLIIVGAVSWTYTIYGFAYYLARGMSEDDLLARQLVQSSNVGHSYVSQISAQELAITPVGAIRSANGKYDLYARARNNNQKWYVEFDYYFLADGRETKKAHGYILPLEEKYLFALAEDFADSPSAAAVVLENLRWSRIDQHKISNWNEYYNKHLDIKVTDIKYTPAGLSALSEKLNLNQLSFNATNATAFNYWETGFTLLLYRGGSLANINHYILNDFMSGQKRFVELSWPGEIGQVDKIEIVPEINIMKNDIYIKYEGGIGEEK